MSKTIMSKNQTPRTSSLCKNSTIPGTLPASIFGYKPDQIAFFVPNAIEAMKEWKKIGYKEWVTDEVFAIQTKAPYIHDPMNLESFKVKLCFNYDIMPCEFELISVVKGSTVQIPECKELKIYTGLSHVGFHVEDMDVAINEFTVHDFPVMSKINTYRHRSCDHQYEYVFINTQALGFISKLIRRVK